MHAKLSVRFSEPVRAKGGILQDAALVRSPPTCDLTAPPSNAKLGRASDGVHSPSQLALRAAILVAIITGGALLAGIAEFWRLSVGVVIGASGLLAWIAIRFAQDTARAELGSDELRRLNETLEAQVEARTSDLRDSNARLRSIIESAVDGIIVIDDNGRIETFNPGAERLFGYPERSARAERQHADAVAVPRGARRLPAALPDERRAQDHRHRPRR